jgi:hypothetical protein
VLLKAAAAVQPVCAEREEIVWNVVAPSVSISAERTQSDASSAFKVNQIKADRQIIHLMNMVMHRTKVHPITCWGSRSRFRT